MGEFSLDIGFDVSIKYGIKEIVPKVGGNFILHEARTHGVHGGGHGSNEASLF